jgi:hypothetical protein
MTRRTSTEMPDEPEYTFGTTSDRNTSFDLDPKHTDALKKAAKQRAWDAYDQRMMEYMQPRKYVNASDIEEVNNRSLRHNSGKPDYSLIPMAALAEVARVLEYGASKYERGNWLKPTSWEVSFACLQRHMSAWQAGEDNDDESGRSHIAHAACNLLQMLHMLENHPEELKR